MSIPYIEIIEQCIKELIEKFEQYPHFLISESDVKCWLYRLLVSKESLQGNFLTKDKKYTSLIHTEYPSALRFNVDLVVLDPKNIGKYTSKRQRVMCAVEIKLWSIAHFNVEAEKKLRDRLRDDTQAHKFFIYLAKKASWWREFKEDLLKHKEENEELFLESTATQALVTRIKTEIP